MSLLCELTRELSISVVPVICPVELVKIQIRNHKAAISKVCGSYGGVVEVDGLPGFLDYLLKFLDICEYKV